jgi:hypothetical protein
MKVITVAVALLLLAAAAPGFDRVVVIEEAYSEG